MNKTENQMLIIFGASGDLTARKLIPALYDLFLGGFLPENFAILGTSRSNLSDKEFREKVVTKSPYLKDQMSNGDKDRLKQFSGMLYYQDIGGDYNDDYGGLRDRIEKLNTDLGTNGNYIFYLSTPPDIYETIAKNLSEQTLSDDTNGWRRMIVEKPFGYDLKSARELNRGLQKYFKESQIFRIDHYLGKETVQNLLV
ncbi:MAG: glucose-6-phosphate dehydrogenase, partial [Flavobacteriaceae bacterium]